ncbi:MAG: hypothetical protein DMG15_13580 [Acidobacteria bacterium]|nr:MAG: hypothetical protein DMG16_20970 [Acidobacteriota bacterium]PYS12637.1 MAG: hypothetical protein DMG15_13580 [Acidobacteriota bacterium]
MIVPYLNLCRRRISTPPSSNVASEKATLLWDLQRGIYKNSTVAALAVLLLKSQHCWRVSNVEIEKTTLLRCLQPCL